VPSSILILDPVEGQAVGTQLKAFLERDNSYHVSLTSGVLPSRVIHEGFHVVISVFPSDPDDVEKLLHHLRPLIDQVPIIPVVGAEALSEDFTVPLQSYQDFLVTPLREAEVCLRIYSLFGDERRSRAVSAATEVCAMAQLIGEDPEIVNLKRRLPIVARFESTVLLTGETGTGKERFARALHYSSPRAAKPFLPVNCGAIPIDLFESELYGHRRGAFTGAVTAQPGLIVQAEGGTLFLDEVETLSLASQVKLLRFLQDQVYYAVGSAKPRQANVWIVASTNIELPTRIKEGTFREDLFYRLAVISLSLPPLRERKGDIALLASHFWDLYAARAGRAAQTLSSEVLAALTRHTWPGNVRELQNVLQQLAVLTESEFVRPEDLPIPVVNAPPVSNVRSFAKRKAMVIQEFEKAYLTELLRVHGGNVTHAAQEAGKDRRAFGRLIKKHHVAK
jgi:two-component system response regulator GlrR